ncbi:hypothetical protein CDL12_13124 [Handroanthus impetiginosus]|uniref:Uncharacterized protein n=1 Tax=Handroanthus impetiginosus TaxID=429701 RepID=A0A2G9H9N2_9LAMI|nr:hypothetical protein CDL12_13124 [Handroanthus impetiginosus]
MIKKARTTTTLDENDPNVAAAVAELIESSNSWVAKYRREKALLGTGSFRHISGPTAPIPAKKKQRILEQMDTAERALLMGG